MPETGDMPDTRREDLDGKLARESELIGSKTVISSSNSTSGQIGEIEDQQSAEVEPKAASATAPQASEENPKTKDGNDARNNEEEGADGTMQVEETVASPQSGDSKLWMYLDGVNPTQHGPFPQLIMLKLLRTGSAHKDMMAWSEGMPDWRPIGQIDAFRETSELAATPWLYLSENSEQRGPVTAAALALLLRQGEVDGMTLAWTTGMGEWKPLGEVSELRTLIQDEDLNGDDDDDDDDDGNGEDVGNQEGREENLEMMVFEGSDEVQPAYEPPPKDSKERKQSKRSFMADDGTKYAWDGEAEDWREIEGDEEDELEEDEEEEDEGREPWRARRAKQHSKGKAGEVEDAGESSGGGNKRKAPDGTESKQGGVVSKRQNVSNREGDAGKASALGADKHGKDDEEEEEEEEGGEEEEEEEEEDEDPSGDDPSKGARAEQGESRDEEAGPGGVTGKGTGQTANKQKKKKKSKKKKGSSWSNKAANLWVYVKGLPSDVSMEEVRDHFGKCGIIALDPQTQQPKIKIYRDEYGHPKGDGSVCYVKAESVDMALNVLHEGQIRPRVKIEVSKAVFAQKGDTFDTSKRLRVNDARVKVARAAQKQALAWTESDDTGATKGGLKIVVVLNMFRPADFEANDRFGEELEADILAEGEKLGPVEKITVFSKNAKGPVVIKFGTAYAAGEAVKTFDGRFFGGRKLSCQYWDGVTDYTVKEEDKDEERRLDAFGDWLEEQELPEELRPRTEA